MQSDNPSKFNSPKLAIKRIQKELVELQSCEDITGKGINIIVNEDDILNLIGEISGPIETPYESGTFKLAIRIPEEYPFYPPKIHFKTRIWHPNISSINGEVCLDILKTGQWSGAMSLRTALLSLQALLSTPEPDDPLEQTVASQYKRSHDMFDKTARNWAQAYAGATSEVEADFVSKMNELLSMGVGESTAREALSENDWNMEKAADQIFSGKHIFRGSMSVQEVEERLNQESQENQKP